MRGGDDPRRLVEIVDRTLQDSFGIDPTSEHDDVCALATTGLVVSCWRNTVLESIHAGGFVSNARRGSYARDGIPDRDMARLNVATWRQVRPHVHPTGIDVLAVRALLRDHDENDLELALRAPNELDDDAIHWLMKAKYDSSFNNAIAAWKRQRGGSQADHVGGPWFLPGVPDLPPHLR